MILHCTYNIYFGIVLMYLVLATDCAPCTEDPKSPKGTAIINVAKVTQGDNCTLTISNVNKTKQMSVQFTEPASSNLLYVYDGVYNASSNLTNLLYNSTGKSGSVWLVTFSDVTTFLFKRLDASKKNISIMFDSTSCVKEVVSREITPPLHLPNKMAEVNCVYDIKETVNMTEYTNVLSFLEFNLPHSTITALGKKKETFTGNTRPDDFFFSSDQLQLQLSMKMLNVSQDFRIVLSQTITDCSKMITVNTTTGLDYSINIPSQHSSITECRLVFSSENKKPLMLEIVSVKLQGADSLALADGGSQGDQSLVSQNDHLDSSSDGLVLLTSRNKLWVRAVIDTLPGAREVTLHVTQTEAGGRFYGGGDITLGASSKNLNADVTASYYYQLVTPSQVQLKLNDAKISGSVEIYDGLEMKNRLTTFSPGDKFYPVTSTGKQMLVVARNFTKTDKVTASYADAPDSCDQVTSDVKGSYSLTKLGNDQNMCQWTISPSNTEEITVLQLSAISLRVNESVTVTALVPSEKPHNLAVFQGPVMLEVIPQVHIPANARTQVTFESTFECANGTTCEQPLVLASFNTAQDCKKTFPPPSGVITSPNWPNIYPINSQCVWSDAENETISKYKLLYLTFDQLDLPDNHTLTLHTYNGTKNHTHAVYTGSKLPGDVVAKGDNYELTFSSMQKSTELQATYGEGFQATYTYLECGETINSKASGVIQSPGYPKLNNESVICAWIIKLPNKDATTESKDIIKFDLHVNHQNTSNPTCVNIHDGPSVRDVLLSSACPHNKTSNTTGLLSRYNTIFILYNMTQTPHLAFNLSFSTYKCGNYCDNGVCIHNDWWCNDYDDCGDGTDERNCLHPVVPTTPKPPAPRKRGKSGGVAGYWVPICLLFGIGLGVVGVFLIPYIIKRLRFRNYNHLHEVSNPVA